MNNQCFRCQKIFSSSYSLQRHLVEKSLPCDLQCPDCVFKADNKNKYYYHKRTVHTTKNKTQEIHSQDIQTKEIKTAEPPIRVRLPGAPKKEHNSNLIPIQDFDPDCIRQLMDLANEKDTEIVLEKVTMRMTIRPLKKKRVEEAIGMFEASDYAMSLQCLDKNVNQVAANILNKFHGDPARPTLHSIHMSDFARKIINIYSRLPELDEFDEHIAQTKWLSFSKEAAFKTISKHISTLSRYALKKAADMLQYKFCVREQVVCFCLKDDVLDKSVIIVNKNDFEDDNDGIIASLGYAPVLKVLLYDGEVTDIEQGYGYTDKAVELGNLINHKMGEVEEQLKNLVFTDADIMSFLEKTRRPFSEPPIMLLE